MSYFCSRFQKQPSLLATGCSAVGSAPGLGPGGRPFESGRPDRSDSRRYSVVAFFIFSHFSLFAIKKCSESLAVSQKCLTFAPAKPKGGAGNMPIW